MIFSSNIDRKMEKSGKENAYCYLCEMGKNSRKWTKKVYSKMIRRQSKNFLQKEFTFY